MDKAKRRVVERKRRAERIRKRVSGNSGCPRLCVRRSLTGIYAQIIDDATGTTLVCASSAASDVRDKVASLEKATKSDVSKLVGELLAGKAKEKGITKVVFDRKGYPYHGRVKALAEAARSNGLTF